MARRHVVLGLLVVVLVAHTRPAHAVAVREKDVTLDLARVVQRELRLRGVRVALTRTSDTSVPLRSRVATADRLRADLLVSIHVNAFKNPSRRGANAVFQTGNLRSAAVARAILAAIGRTDARVRGAYSVKGRRGGDYYYVLRNSRRPAVIVEVAALSNATDARLLSDPRRRTRLAVAIAAGIQRSVRKGAMVAVDPGHGGRDPGTQR